MDVAHRGLILVASMEVGLPPDGRLANHHATGNQLNITLEFSSILIGPFGVRQVSAQPRK